jgi:lipid II:glycine glycyltransferase (peptidoglycan interpeptide bridge formation enzyme)
MKSILQTKQWASFKSNYDFEILNLGNIFVHKRKLPFNQNFLYIPEMSAKHISPQEVEDLAKLAKEQDSIFTRLELVDEFSDSGFKLLGSFGFKKSFEQVQPKWRQIIDLKPTRGEILAQMKQKGRYNVKLAERKDVKIINFDFNSTDFKKQLEVFHRLIEDTVKREGISGRSMEYFSKMLEAFKETDYLKIYIAYYNGIALSAALVSFYEGVASYLYGGSSRDHREVMGPYLMHWQIICDAKDLGMQSYDMLGIAPTGSENHKWSGVTKFKEQFGGRAVEILGSFDYINKPVAYKLFQIAEKTRRK